VARDELLDQASYELWAAEAGFPELRQILLWRWDPIGVELYFPDADDEYDTYALALLARLHDGATAGAVARYLLWVERTQMDMPKPSSYGRLRDLGERIVDWYDGSVSRWRERRERG
jgi:hypothetical protein